MGSENMALLNRLVCCFWSGSFMCSRWSPLVNGVFRLRRIHILRAQHPKIKRCAVNKCAVNKSALDRIDFAFREIAS